MEVQAAKMKEHVTLETRPIAVPARLLDQLLNAAIDSFGMGITEVMAKIGRNIILWRTGRFKGAALDAYRRTVWFGRVATVMGGYQFPERFPRAESLGCLFLQGQHCP